MSARVRSLKNLALRLTAWLPRERRAVWLTTFYELWRVIALGHREPWLDNYVRNAYVSQVWRRLLPLRWWLVFHAVFYCVHLHRHNHVLPGVWRALGASETLPSAGLPRDAFPQWMQEDLLELSKIDAQLFPNAEFFNKYHAWRTHVDTSGGDLLAKAWTALQCQQKDIIVVAPWLRAGGADKGVLQFLNFYLSRGFRVALITTFAGQSTRLNLVPRQVDVLEFGLMAGALSIEELTYIFTRLLLLINPHIVHNALSELAWHCFAVHGRALRASGIKLMASLYTEEYGVAGRRMGYAVDFLPRCRTILDALITDSSAWANKFSAHYALNSTIVKPIPFYVHTTEITHGSTETLISYIKQEGSYRILWAGRLCTQKRPDLLFEIAKCMPLVRFDVHGPIEQDSVKWAQALSRLPNVKLFGEYANFYDIVKASQYDLLLYTTSFDGMPNVLLEAASVGLPIVAPADLGGLSELIDASTAFCVSDVSDAKSYVKTLRFALDHPDVAAQKSLKASERLRKKFSREIFEQEMDKIIHQLGVLSSISRVHPGLKK